MTDTNETFEPVECFVDLDDEGRADLYDVGPVTGPSMYRPTKAVLLPRDLYERLVGEDWKPIETAPTRKWVLVSGPIDDGEPWVTLAVKLDCGEWYDSEHDVIPEPTHWRPLPKGPQ